ncbi:MAG: VanZ family protein [Myxococcota bacterium]
MSRARRSLVSWLPAVAYMALIWFVSSIDLGRVSVDFLPLRDKAVHFVEYAVLGFFVAYAVRMQWPDRPGVRRSALAFAITLAWGILDEFHQAFVPGRSGEVLDIVADGTGAVAGIVAFLIVARLRERRRGPRKRPRPQGASSS